MIPLPPVGHTAISSVNGPLLVVRDTEGVGWDEFATIRVADGGTRHGLVLESDRDVAVLEVLEGTAGLDPGRLIVEFSGAPFAIPVGEGWLGRTCNGRGAPLDGGPAIRGRRRTEVAGRPLNPARRAVPEEPIITGVSALDGMATLVRGQKLPIFSEGGLPHLELATQIAAQARIGEGRFSIVFVAMGLTHSDADAAREVLEGRAAAGELTLILNTADDPVIERILAPRVGLTIAEHLAFTLDHHVLVIMADMTSYAEAVREVASARGETPGRRGYPGYLFSDLASLYERCGRVSGRKGSLTQVPVLTMPAGDITHPVPDLTGYITEGQIVLTPELHNAGVYPPFEALSSLSRLMRHGAGPERTREDHLDVAATLYASLSRARQARELADLIGSEALSAADQAYLRFATELQGSFLSQGVEEDRDIGDTLDRAWRSLSALPRRELALLPAAMVDAHLADVGDGDASPTG